MRRSSLGLEGMSRWNKVPNRVCYACGNEHSYIVQTKNGVKYENWFLNKPTDLTLCSLCNKKFVYQLTNQRRYIRDKEKLSEYNRRQYLSNKEKHNQVAKQWRDSNKDYLKVKAKLYRAKLKFIVFNRISHGKMICACCGENEFEFLTVDHINNDGNITRHKLNLYGWLIRNNFPEGFQILCYNCNCARGAVGFCPHQQESNKIPILLSP